MLGCSAIWRGTRWAVQRYEELEGDRFHLQITFALIFLVVAILLLLVAVWIGSGFRQSDDRADRQFDRHRRAGG